MPPYLAILYTAIINSFKEGRTPRWICWVSGIDFFGELMAVFPSPKKPFVDSFKRRFARIFRWMGGKDKSFLQYLKGFLKKKKGFISEF